VVAAVPGVVAAVPGVVMSGSFRRVIASRRCEAEATARTADSAAQPAMP